MQRLFALLRRTFLPASCSGASFPTPTHLSGLIRAARLAESSAFHRPEAAPLIIVRAKRTLGLVLLAVLGLLAAPEARAQCCEVNMSFERAAGSCFGQDCNCICNPDPIGPGEAWLSCPSWGCGSTDIGPNPGGDLNMGNTQPTDGNSFLSMTCSGGPGGMGEGISLTLCTGVTLTAGTQYCFSLDLITRANFGNSAGTSRLRIYGSSSTCQTTELLWDSPTLTGQWQTYNFCFTPTGNWNVISFRVVNAQGGFTSVGVDRWVSTDGLFPPNQEVPEPVTGFSYPTPLCASGGAASPTLSTGFTPGGTFTAGNGLSINASTGVINVGASAPGTYTVTYTIPAGACSPGGSSSAQVSIVSDASAAIAYPGGPFCTNAAPVSPQVTGAAGGVFSSTTGLSIDAQSGVIQPALSQAGSYTVTYSLTPPPPCAPFSTTAQVVIQGPQAAFQANPSSGLAPLVVALVNSSTGQGLSYAWTWPGGGSSEEEPTATFLDAGTYVIQLVVIDAFGCTSTASAQVVVSDPTVPVTPVLVIPNVFSPNGDGPNDRYRVTSSGLTYLSMEIYNRWGQVVGRLSRPDDSWDGRSLSGETVPEGTYFHHLTVRDPVNGERTFSGHITLLR